MPTSSTPGGQGGQSSSSSSTAAPCALDFARLLHARQKVRQGAQTYLAQLQTQIQVVLEQQGYQDISLQPLEGSSATPDVAGSVMLLILMRLPLDGLQSPVFKVQLPLAVTHGRELRVHGAQINEFNVPESFVHPLEPDIMHVAQMLIQGLSQRYMDYLLQTGGDPSPTTRA